MRENGRAAELAPLVKLSADFEATDLMGKAHRNAPRCGWVHSKRCPKVVWTKSALISTISSWLINPVSIQIRFHPSQLARSRLSPQYDPYILELHRNKRSMGVSPLQPYEGLTRFFLEQIQPWSPMARSSPARSPEICCVRFVSKPRGSVSWRANPWFPRGFRTLLPHGPNLNSPSRQLG